MASKEHPACVEDNGKKRGLTPFEAQVGHGMPPINHQVATPGLKTAAWKQVVGNGWSVLATGAVFNTLPPQVARMSTKAPK